MIYLCLMIVLYNINGYWNDCGILLPWFDKNLLRYQISRSNWFQFAYVTKIQCFFSGTDPVWQLKDGLLFVDPTNASQRWHLIHLRDRSRIVELCILRGWCEPYLVCICIDLKHMIVSCVWHKPTEKIGYEFIYCYSGLCQIYVFIQCKSKALYTSTISNGYTKENMNSYVSCCNNSQCFWFTHNCSDFQCLNCTSLKLPWSFKLHKYANYSKPPNCIHITKLYTGRLDPVE